MVTTYLFQAGGAGGGGGNFPSGITSGTPADALVNATIDGLDIRDFEFVYNGTSWDRIRSVGGATSTTGTGLLGAGMMYFDNPNGVFRVSQSAESSADGNSGSTIPSSGSQYVYNGTTYDQLRGANGVPTGTTGTGMVASALYISDSSLFQRVFTISGLSDSNNGAHAMGIGLMAFNGSSYDRVRASTDGTSLTGALRMIAVSYSYAHATVSAGTTVKATSGVLHSVTINTAVAAGVLTLFDNTTATGTTIAVVSIATFQGTLTFDISFLTGLSYIIVGATADVTITWR